MSFLMLKAIMFPVKVGRLFVGIWKIMAPDKENRFTQKSYQHIPMS